MFKIKSLSGQVLHVADADSLAGANLRGANLHRADLTGAHLRYADLRGADLTGAYLRYATLSRANLHRADLTGAHLHYADLTGADLTGAYLGEQWIVQGGTRSDGYAFFLQKLTGDVEPMVKAGCRYLTLPAAQAHWEATRAGEQRLAETEELIRSMVAVARVRGLL